MADYELTKPDLLRLIRNAIARGRRGDDERAGLLATQLAHRCRAEAFARAQKVRVGPRLPRGAR